MSVIGRLSKMGHVVSRKKTKDKLQYPPPCASMRPGDEVEVVVSSTDSPSSFYVQLVSYVISGAVCVHTQGCS